jgi:oligopeptide transport system permease protein
MSRLAGRCLEAVITVWLLVSLCFVLLRLAPGGPFDSERALAPEIEAQMAGQFALDLPAHVQYLRYLGQLLRGDLGPSFQYSDYSVNELLAGALPVSLLLGSGALLFAFSGGIVLGGLAALRRDSWLDRALMALTGLGQSLPKFVAAPLLISLFALTLGWLPAGGWDAASWRHAVLPMLALALPNLAYAARLFRASLIETLGSDFVLRARALGLPPHALLSRDALRPALLPLLAFLSPALVAVVTGSAVVEQIFGIPGVGRFFVQGALNRDYTLVLGVVLMAGVGIVLINLAVDALLAWADPRLRRR